MADYDGISHYLKVAPRRVQDAEELLQHPSLNPNERGAEVRHLRSAMYLAGYAVECVLKAYLISHEPPAQSLAEVLKLRGERGKRIANLLGYEGHNLVLLLSLTDLEASLDTHPERKKDWGVCLKWRSDWRYDSTSPKVTDAEVFVRSVRRLHDWVTARL